MRINKIKVGMSVLLSIMLVVTGEQQVLAYTASTDENCVDGKIVECIDEYMEYRNELLTIGQYDSVFENTVVMGIITDELEHFEVLNDLNLERKQSSYVINAVSEWDEMIVADITEYVLYSDKMDEESSVQHEMYLYENNDGGYIVASDRYYDENTDFKSCSFVEVYNEENLIMPLAIGSDDCIIKIATDELGYKEKSSNSNLDDPTANAGRNNYTKYGKWYGLNGQAWCAMFVSWCANQADVSTSIIPKTASCDTGMSTFKNWNKFQYSVAYGGNYVPKVGDIFYTGSSKTDASHTGIIVGVSSSTITVIDGNWNEQVSKHTYSLNDSSLIGFGTPNYGASSHKWTTVNGNQVCAICGASGGMVVK